MLLLVLPGGAARRPSSKKLGGKSVCVVFVGLFCLLLERVQGVDRVVLGRNRGGNGLLSTEHQDLGFLHFILKTLLITGVFEPWNDTLVQCWLKGYESFFLLPAAIESAVCPTVPESLWLAVFCDSQCGHC